MIQGLFFLSFFKLTDHIAVNGSGIKENWKQYVGLALVTYFLFMARSVAAGAIFLAVVVYFLFQKDWKHLLFSLLTFIAVTLPLEGLKKMIWKGASQVASQGNAMFQRIFMIQEKDKLLLQISSLDFGLMQIYLSSKLWEMLGFRNPDSPI